MDAPGPPLLIERLSLVNYKSIAECDVVFRPLTVIVGRNGSGKSNFLDALHFVSDSLVTSLDHAVRVRGGFRAVTRRPVTKRVHIKLTFFLGEGGKGTFELSLDRFSIASESLIIHAQDGEPIASYRRVGPELAIDIAGEHAPPPPAVLRDRLSLVTLSGLPWFRVAFDALASMRFYRLNPDAMRALQDPDEGDVLRSDGSNIASVWRRLQKTDSRVFKRITSYLAAIVPEVSRVHPVRLGPKETLHFHQRASVRDLAFHASSMSDGTLRALGVLVASRRTNGSSSTPAAIGIEEPEAALHPGAVAALMDALHEASAKTQILVTSHSPDVLDHVDVEKDSLLVTEMRDGATVVSEIDAASREAIRRHLYTPGDLLRMGQLESAEVTKTR